MTEKFVGKFKSSEESRRFLKDGRKLFEESKIFEALKSLNESLCFAKNEAEIAKCFELRGEIYFAMGKYEKCLKNIQKVKKIEGKTELELKCLTEIKKSSEKYKEKFTKISSDFFKLSYPANPKNPSIVSCIKLQVNDKFGRHLVANQNINAGEILIIEEPLHKSLDKNFTQGRCVNCFKSNFLDLLPCKYCCSVMFCSDECQKSAWEKFHKFECDSIDELTEEDNFLIMIQRTFFEIIHTFGNLENMQAFLDENLHDVTAFDIDMSDKVELKKKLILIGQSLESSPSTQEDFKFAESFVDYHKHVKILWNTKKQRNFLVNFIVKFIGIMNRNAFTMHWTSPCKDIEEQGCAIFPTVSMINNSCIPNLFRIRKDENIILIARKPIRANEQLFISYHNLFLQKPKEYRQASLQKQFSFLCSCEACEENYPLAKDLEKFDEYFVEPLNCYTSLKTAIEAFNKNCDYIKQNLEEFPSYEICRLMQNNFNILQFISSEDFSQKKD